MGWEKIIDIVAQYGPFPVGIVIGLYIKSWSMNKYVESTEREKDALRDQSKHLHEVIKGKEDRIDKLHDQINLLTTEKKPGGAKK